MNNDALNFWAACGDIDKCNYYLKQGANSFNEAMENAAFNNHIDIVKLMIMHGANNLIEVYDSLSYGQIKLRKIIFEYANDQQKDIIRTNLFFDKIIN